MQEKGRLKLGIIDELYRTGKGFWGRIGIFAVYVHFVYHDKINII